jgi:hypothetical protein
MNNKALLVFNQQVFNLRGKDHEQGIILRPLFPASRSAACSSAPERQSRRRIAWRIQTPENEPKQCCRLARG